MAQDPLQSELDHIVQETLGAEYNYHLDKEAPEPDEIHMDYKKAEWVLMQIQQSTERIQEAQEVYDLKMKALSEAVGNLQDKYRAAYLAQINPWRNTIRHLWNCYGPAIGRFIQERLGGSKKKSEKIAGVQVGSRQVPKKLIVENEERLLEWAKTNLPESIKTTERVLISHVTPYYEKEGEIPPGVLVEEEHDEPVIKAGKTNIIKLMEASHE